MICFSALHILRGWFCSILNFKSVRVRTLSVEMFNIIFYGFFTDESVIARQCNFNLVDYTIHVIFLFIFTGFNMTLRMPSLGATYYHLPISGEFLGFHYENGPINNLFICHYWIIFTISSMFFFLSLFSFTKFFWIITNVAFTQHNIDKN